MKTQEEELTSAKKSYDATVAAIKWRHKVRNLPLEQKVKLIASKKGEEKFQGTPMRERCWNMMKEDERIAAAKIILKSALSVKASIRTGSYLYFGNSGTPRLSNDHYNVTVTLFTRMWVVITGDMGRKPTEDEALKIVQGVFPSVKMIDLR